MKKEDLRAMADKAIARWENPDLIKMPGEPKFQVRSPERVDFPFPSECLGKHKGSHIYVLDARQVIKHLDRFDLEFNTTK